MISSIRNIIIFFISLSVLIPCLSMAEDDLLAASEVIKKQRKVYIENMMELTPQEKEASWSLYAEYESGLSKLRGQRIELATTFLRSHGNISDTEAVDMLEEKLRLDREELEYKQSYIAKFIQVLPGRKVARFYQAENRFDTAAISELYRNMPVIR